MLTETLKLLVLVIEVWVLQLRVLIPVEIVC